MTGDISVLGAARSTSGFDAGRFGGRIDPGEPRCISSRHYSPVDRRRGSVVMRSGDAVLAAPQLDESGLLDITGTIPAESIRPTSASGWSALPAQPAMRSAQRPDTVRPRSRLHVAVTPGTLNRGGFPVLPMAFTPDFDVVVDSPDHLAVRRRGDQPHRAADGGDLAAAAHLLAGGGPIRVGGARRGLAARTSPGRDSTTDGVPGGRLPSTSAAVRLPTSTSNGPRRCPGVLPTGQEGSGDQRNR